MLDVLKLHQNREDVVVVAVECLKRLSVDVKISEEIFDNGGVDAVLDACLNNKNTSYETLLSCLELLENVAKHSSCVDKLAAPDLVAKGAAFAEQIGGMAGKGKRFAQKPGAEHGDRATGMDPLRMDVADILPL